MYSTHYIFGSSKAMIALAHILDKNKNIILRPVATGSVKNLAISVDCDGSFSILHLFDCSFTSKSGIKRSIDYSLFLLFLTHYSKLKK